MWNWRFHKHLKKLWGVKLAKRGYGLVEYWIVKYLWYSETERTTMFICGINWKHWEPIQETLGKGDDSPLSYPKTNMSIRTGRLQNTAGGQDTVLSDLLSGCRWPQYITQKQVKCFEASYRHSVSPIYTLPISELGLLLDLFPCSGFVSKLERSGLTQESLELDVLASPPPGPPTTIGANSWLLSCNGNHINSLNNGIDVNTVIH